MYEFEQTINEQQRKIEELKMKLQTYQQQLQLAPTTVQVLYKPVSNQQLQNQIQAMQHQIQKDWMQCNQIKLLLLPLFILLEANQTQAFTTCQCEGHPFDTYHSHDTNPTTSVTYPT